MKKLIFLTVIVSMLISTRSFAYINYYTRGSSAAMQLARAEAIAGLGDEIFEIKQPGVPYTFDFENTGDLPLSISSTFVTYMDIYGVERQTNFHVGFGLFDFGGEVFGLSIETVDDALPSGTVHFSTFGDYSYLGISFDVSPQESSLIREIDLMVTAFRPGKTWDHDIYDETSAVPEASTFILVGVGLIVMIGLARKRFFC